MPSHQADAAHVADMGVERRRKVAQPRLQMLAHARRIARHVLALEQVSVASAAAAATGWAL
jgi:hypothetical protein